MKLMYLTLLSLTISGKDVCACAATGTGKTAAYMLPILERLLYKASGSDRVTRVLVLVPTRELGAQVYFYILFYTSLYLTYHVLAIQR